MSAGNRRAWTIGPILVGIVATAEALGVWAATRDDLHHMGTGPSIRVDLLKQAHPRPSCPNAPAAPRTRPGQKLITVLAAAAAIPGVRRVMVSADGRWVAWGTEGVCGTDSEFGLADLSHPGSSASITGPARESQADPAQLRRDRRRGPSAIALGAEVRADG